MTRLLPAVPGLALVFGLSAAHAASVTVTVSGVRNDKGHVRVAVCTKPQFLAPHCGHDGSVRATSGSVSLTLADIPPGVYAVQVFHDESDQGVLHTNFLGIPREGLGFSREPAIRFGPPAFADAAFTLGPSGGTIPVKMHYHN